MPCGRMNLIRSVIVLALVVLILPLSQAQTLTLLHTFCSAPNCTDGKYPEAGVIQDTVGNLYGTTNAGGTFNAGGVYKINSSGTESVLYNFTGGSDGSVPSGGLLRDSAGNLYGTTAYGGTSGTCQTGCGTMFRISPTGQETILHNFGTGASDGIYPYYTNLVRDKSGNLYGITSEGGTANEGVVYKFSTAGTITNLHEFTGGTTDGCNPYGTPVMDGGGNLYGTAEFCGSSNLGMVWKVGGNGVETILHNFAGYPSDGAYPVCGLVRDPSGNFYGTTQQGASHDGTIFRLNSGGIVTMLHRFSYSSDGSSPQGDLLGNLAKRTLYGTTLLGGTGGSGTVWSLK